MTSFSRPRFGGKSVLITGAASGIGRETAIQFGNEGALVTILDINGMGANETADIINRDGGTARVSVCDVSDPVAMEEAIRSAVAEHGRLDVLHNNAFWAPLGQSVVDTTPEDWDRTIDVSLKGVFLGCKFAIPYMVKEGGGVIVNTASVTGLAGTPTFAAYIAAKGGVIALTRSVAFDFAKQGIRCNAVAPGLIKTAATERVFRDPERMRFMESKFLLGRPGEPREIAYAVLFLASDESSFMTGQTIVIDGGRMIC